MEEQQTKSRRGREDCGGSKAGAEMPVPVAAPIAPAAPRCERQDHDRRFCQDELRVGIVKVAERVPKADKLLRLEIDIGNGSPSGLGRNRPKPTRPRRSLAVRWLSSPTLPRGKLRGLESEWDDVAASLEGGEPVLASLSGGCSGGS